MVVRGWQGEFCNRVIDVSVCSHPLGWQWEPNDRPAFASIHNDLDNLFQHSSISEGKKIMGRNSFAFIRQCVLHYEKFLADDHVF